MRSNKGITLTSLVILIILIIILSSVAAYTGMETIENSKKLIFRTELETIRSKVNIYHEKGEVGYISIEEEQSAINNLSQSMKDILIPYTKNTSLDNFCYFKNSDYQKIELTGIKQDTIINFRTKEIISVNGIIINDVVYRTLSDLGETKYENSYENKNIGIPTFDVKIYPLEKNSWTITIDNIVYPGNVNGGILYYKLSSDTIWKEAKNISFKVYNIGTYDLKLIDKAGNESQIKKEYIFSKNDLLLYLDGERNNSNGHNNSSIIWEDLTGNGNTGTINNTSDFQWGNNYIENINSTGNTNIDTLLNNNQIERTYCFTVSNVEENIAPIFSDANQNNELGFLNYNSYIEQRNTTVNQSKINYNFYNTEIINYIIVVSNSRIKLYKNGKFIQEIENLSGLNGGTLRLFGGKNTNELSKKMKLYNFLVYGKELNEDEIKQTFELNKLKFNIQ